MVADNNLSVAKRNYRISCICMASLNFTLSEFADGCALGRDSKRRGAGLGISGSPKLDSGS
jgi:hypothetical protein